MSTPSYYRTLARDLMRDAAAAEDAAIAARLRERAEDYLILAQALEDAPQSPPPAPMEPAQSTAQQQQQVQPKKDENKD